MVLFYAQANPHPLGYSILYFELYYPYAQGNRILHYHLLYILYTTPSLLLLISISQIECEHIHSKFITPIDEGRAYNIKS